MGELTVYPRREIQKILEISAKNQNDKVRITATVNAKEARVKATAKRARDTESENFRLKHNNEILTKQVESLSKKVTLLESRRGERESRGRRAPDVEVRTLQLRLAQAEQAERRLREEMSRNEERNLGLLKRKEALMRSVREELEQLRGNIAGKEGLSKGICHEDSKLQNPPVNSNSKSIGAELVRDLKDQVRRLRNQVECRDVTLATSQMQLQRDRHQLASQIEELRGSNKALELEAQQFKRRAGLLEKKVTQLTLDNEQLKADYEKDESFLCGDGPADSGTEFSSPMVGTGLEIMLSAEHVSTGVFGVGVKGLKGTEKGLQRQRSKTENVNIASRFQEKKEGVVKRHKTFKVQGKIHLFTFFVAI